MLLQQYVDNNLTLIVLIFYAREIYNETLKNLKLMFVI